MIFFSNIFAKTARGRLDSLTGRTLTLMQGSAFWGDVRITRRRFSLPEQYPDTRVPLKFKCSAVSLELAVRIQISRSNKSKNRVGDIPPRAISQLLSQARR